MSFASNQVSRLETLLQQNVGVQSVTVNGHAVTYDDLLKHYNYWKSRQARENKTRPRSAQIYLPVVPEQTAQLFQSCRSVIIQDPGLTDTSVNPGLRCTTPSA